MVLHDMIKKYLIIFIQSECIIRIIEYSIFSNQNLAFDLVSLSPIGWIDKCLLQSAPVIRTSCIIGKTSRMIKSVSLNYQIDHVVLVVFHPGVCKR